MDEKMSALYNELRRKATEHAARQGLSEKWAMGFLNAMWYTIEGHIRVLTAPERRCPHGTVITDGFMFCCDYEP